MFVEKDYKMKMKQQKQIEEFLNEEFETEKGKEIYLISKKLFLIKLQMI